MSGRVDAATDLNLIREQCGTLELALQTETDPARLSDLRRELAECRQRAFEVEQRDQPEAEREAGGPAGDSLATGRRARRQRAGPPRSSPSRPQTPARTMPACMPPSASRAPSYGRSWPQKGRAQSPAAEAWSASA
jgi:hypothetical protein